jgi:very-short-patch-repair endonuclease
MKDSPIEKKLFTPLEIAASTLGWKIERQVRFHPYTADFLVTTKDGARFVVEADGHTYHSSPEQVMKDRIRDRWFLRRGIITLRYSGEEIRRSAEGCMTDIVRTVASITPAAAAVEEHW